MHRCFPIRQGASAKGHIDDLHITLNGIIETEYQIGSTLENTVFIAFSLDHNNIYVRSNTDNLTAVHRGSNYARYSSTVALFILDQRPVIAAILAKPVLYDFVLSRVIGILTDPSGKFRMIGINTGIDHRYRNARSGIGVPYILHIEVIKVRLKLIIAVRNGTGRTGRNTFPREFLGLSLVQLRHLHLIVGRHILNIVMGILSGINIPYGNTLRQSQRSKTTILCNTKSGSKLLGQLFSLYWRGVVKNNASIIILSDIPFQLF